MTGGLTDFSPPEGLFFLDYDQRSTLSTGFTVNLRASAYVSANVNYGSGFLDGDGPNHLPGHKTLDFSLGKGFGESWRCAANVNLTIDDSCWTAPTRSEGYTYRDRFTLK